MVVTVRKARAQVNSEYAVKAAFLFHFAQLTAWPADALPANATLTICTLGKDPFSGELERVIGNKPVQTHSVTIVHHKDSPKLRSCQILFLSAQQESDLAVVVASLRGYPVLLVGETDTFLHRGGMIAFGRQEERLRFTVNVRAAAKSSVSFSSILLALAASVLP
jgi:hypothetical protein